MEITKEDYEAFLEHHGVLGQKWGVHRERARQRRIATQQHNINRLKRVALGKKSRVHKGDAFVASMYQIPIKDIIIGKGTKGGARRVLERQQRRKRQIEAGHLKALDILNKAFGIDVRTLDFNI